MIQEDRSSPLAMKFETISARGKVRRSIFEHGSYALERAL
jgi:hypothetical protein